MDFINRLARIVERHGWNEVLATLHNLALSQDRNEIVAGLRDICHDDSDATAAEEDADFDGELV